MTITLLKNRILDLDMKNLTFILLALISVFNLANNVTYLTIFF